MTRRIVTCQRKDEFSDSDTRRLIHGYYAARSYTDAQIGKLLDSLNSAGLAEFSIVRVLPRGPVESIENFVEQPDGMVFRDFLFETGGNEEDLIFRA